MLPPTWALLEREVIRANEAACQAYFERYFDTDGFLLCVTRWGGNDGPDDAGETFASWPELHALGGADFVLNNYRKAWEGHLRQFTLAKNSVVEIGRDGMYYKEFPVMFDWQHNGEGLSAFNQQGLSQPGDPDFARRTRRFAGFYLNEDGGAQNYDQKLRLIRSAFNGSRGPLLRKATALDWAGDPIDVENRFAKLIHGENSYDQMLEHFREYTDVVGDHPLNLMVTSVMLNAYMLEGEKKYRTWIIEYVNAWKQRMLENDGIIPSNVGRDGVIGSDAEGKWYGGVYGWGFSPLAPHTGKREDRNRVALGFVGFMNAYLVTGDDSYLESWRAQTRAVNSHSREEDGRMLYPRMCGDQGWYGYSTEKFSPSALELYFLSWRPEDRVDVPPNPWLDFLEGRRPGFPEEALRKDLQRIHGRMRNMRADQSSPDSRLADEPLNFNPVSVNSLMQLMWGALPRDVRGRPVYGNVRYFDSALNRAGVPSDVAALVDKVDATSISLVLINLSPVHEKQLVVQAGAFGEHTIDEVDVAGEKIKVGERKVAVKIAPGAGSRLTLSIKRYNNQPTLKFP